MKKIKFLSILLFLAILSPVFVKADSVSYTAVGYGYTQSEYGTTLTWDTYNTNNLVKYNYNLPNSDYIEITEFDLRFSLGSGNQFKKGYNYVLSFYWFNDYDNSTFSVYYQRMIHSLSCRKDNWNTTNQYGTDCFISESIEIEQDTSVNGLIRLNLRFTPIKDFFGLTMQNKHDNVIYENYLSEGWEVYNISYLVVEDGTQSIINNQNQNTENIINNQDSNTQDIIDNQNQNTQSIIDSNKACISTIYTKNNGVSRGYLDGTGSISANPSSSYIVTDYISIDSDSKLKVLLHRSGGGNYCFYNSSKSYISCSNTTNIADNTFITLPSNVSYVRFTFHIADNLPRYEITICKNGNQAVVDSITDDDVSGANSSASNFFSSFTTETYGLTSVITAPLSFIQSLTSKTCSPLVLPLPYVNRNLELPCMTSIYQEHFGSFLTLYQTITFGIISYWVVVRIFNLVKDFKNPDHDEIEVMDL